jgi:hypothetical protein
MHSLYFICSLGLPPGFVCFEEVADDKLLSGFPQES